MMRFGVCAGLDMAEAAARAGWDFIEVSVGTFMPSEPDSAYAEVRSRIARLPIPVEAANCFIPGNLRLTGPEVNPDALLAYVEVAFRRMAEAGLKVVVLGSGGARNLPDGWPEGRGLEQLADFLRAAAAVAHEVGMMIAVEPLRRTESNIINRVADAVALCGRVEHPSVRPLADLFHMAEEGEPSASVAAVASSLAHVHVADSGRVPPGRGEMDFSSFLGALAEGGYRGRVSVECSWDDFEAQQDMALATLREAWAAL
jgi:sugar phosphate isomerase/epimerase